MAGSTRSKILNTLQLSNDYTIKPAGLRWRSNTIFIVATVAIGLFTDLFLYGLVVPILPFMLRDRVGLPAEQVQSNVSGLLAAYAGASVICSPLAGLLADRISTRQAPFLWGLTALLGATILLFFGNSVAVLAVARVLQGISAAFVWTIGLALALETVGPENLGKTIGSIFSFISVGNLFAPLLGGVLYEKAGYVGVFSIGFGIIAIDFAMRLLVIEKRVAKRYETNDPDAGDRETSADDQQDATHDEENGDEDNEEQPLLGGKEEDEASFKLSNNQPKLAQYIPILPCLANPRLLTAFLVAFVQAMLLGNFDATIPTVAEEYFHVDSLKAGLLFMPLGVADFILGPVFGWCVDRFGTKPVGVFAYTYLVPALIVLRIPHPGGQQQMLLYGGLLALCGVGLAGIGAPSIVEAGAIVQKYYEVNPDFFGDNGPYAQLYGLNSMVFSAGLTLGPELAGELKQFIGYGNMNLVLAGICAVTAILCFVYIGGKPRILSRKR
ncbi:hypothetical protein LTR78_002114 [Recurvomyces mirabilis]|uniref:Major facilitator superfamily (MFS) profile domain-containing protein n=1 Tax=Recurvomyces mirabilis TaxID=574656 RepID=A0AAE1C4L1_9PEZI|nr:hypothetical protein LTR78_002114 [Recurvomyces mirabilis]KAK5160572.1 hypothetical protein LTS14_001584 [Recurvomyces mirabilis]